MAIQLFIEPCHIFDAAFRMQDAVTSHPELKLMGKPTFCFSFTSDDFDIYHVNDFMRPKGWRFNGQQYPNALHMAPADPAFSTHFCRSAVVDVQALQAML